MVLALFCVSLVAVAETYYDQKFYTADFLNEVEEVNLDLPPLKEKRIVASEVKKKLPLIQEVPMNLKSLIDGKWEITRVIDEEGNTAFSSTKSREKVTVSMELVDVSVVRIDSDLDQTFLVSLFTREGTLALFKEFGDGFEIVEARRIKEEKKAVEEAIVEEAKEEKSKYDIEEDLFLVSGLDPQKNRNVLRGEALEGYAYLKNGELILENIKLHLGTNNQTETFSTEARIQNHGTFNDGRGTQGIITNVTKDEIKVRFSTGPLTGAMLNFVTYQKKSEIEAKFGATTQATFPQEEQPQPEVKKEEAPINGQYEQPEQYPEVKDSEEAQEEYYDDEAVQEVDGERINDEALPQFDETDGEDFQSFRNDFEDEQVRGPSSVSNIEKTGFSF